MADAVAAVQFVETSAKDNINVDTAFREITKVNVTAWNYYIVVSTEMKKNCFKKQLYSNSVVVSVSVYLERWKS